MEKKDYSKLDKQLAICDVADTDAEPLILEDIAIPAANLESFMDDFRKLACERYGGATSAELLNEDDGDASMEASRKKYLEEQTEALMRAATKIISGQQFNLSICLSECTYRVLCPPRSRIDSSSSRSTRFLSDLPNRSSFQTTTVSPTRAYSSISSRAGRDASAPLATSKANNLSGGITTRGSFGSARLEKTLTSIYMTRARRSWFQYGVVSRHLGACCGLLYVEPS